MKTRITTNLSSNNIQAPWSPPNFRIHASKGNIRDNFSVFHPLETAEDHAEILFISSYPPRECGIATYSQDLIDALNTKFSTSISIKVCALESGAMNYAYPGEVVSTLDTSNPDQYKSVAAAINSNKKLKLVLIQHEFGFFRKQEEAFQDFISTISKPIILVFHTVLIHPNEHLLTQVRKITDVCRSVIVMTHNSAEILIKDYGVRKHKISIIPHGTHLVPHLNVEFLKSKYGLSGRKVLSTFGLLNAGKGIETTLDAMPAIIEQCPEVIFLLLGKTHPEVVTSEGEKYRSMLEKKVSENGLQDHVVFINNYLSLSDLLEYLQLTDVYLFTTKDPNQAVSGTFAYAMSCACPIISTPIPHAKELLSSDTGIIFDFGRSDQLAEGVIRLLKDENLRRTISTNALQKIVSTAWENSAVSHAMLIWKITGKSKTIKYNVPVILLDHLDRMSTETGIIQFSRVNQPDIQSGYTLDDNARALVTVCMHYMLTGDNDSILKIRKYLRFIHHCQQPSGEFLNYVNENNEFTVQNEEVNLDDSNGRALWALGYTLSLHRLLPHDISALARVIFENRLQGIDSVYSPRAMAFTIKGMYYYLNAVKNPGAFSMVKVFANRLVQMYRQESSTTWEWFEAYLTYANSILPESLLYAYLLTGEETYKDIAVSSLDFLLSQTFNANGIEVISNKGWLIKGKPAGKYGEQPIDVAYTVMTLGKFYEVLKEKEYRDKMETAFNWFLGSNRLHQIVYNPRTGGCYDGLEETHVNLNQGAESTVSYLMARLTFEKYRNTDHAHHTSNRKHVTMHVNQHKLMYSTGSTLPPDQPKSIS